MSRPSVYQQLLSENKGKLPQHWDTISLATLQQVTTDALDVLEACSLFYDQVSVNAENWRDLNRVEQRSLTPIATVMKGDLSGPVPDPQEMYVLWEGRQGAGPVTECPRADLIKALVRAHEDLETVLAQSDRVARLMQTFTRRLREGEIVRSSVLETRLAEVNDEAARAELAGAASRRRPRPL